MKYEVTEITRTCLACPSQWEGKLADGREFYMRYRWGGYGFGVGKDGEEAVDNSEYVSSIGDTFDGFLTDLAMMKEAVKHGFVFGPNCWKSEPCNNFPDFSFPDISTE